MRALTNTSSQMPRMPTIWLSATSTHWPGANSVEAVNIISTTQKISIGLCSVALIISPGETGASVEALTGGNFSIQARPANSSAKAPTIRNSRRQDQPQLSAASPISAPPTTPAGYQACRMPNRPTRSSG